MSYVLAAIIHLAGGQQCAAVAVCGAYEPYPGEPDVMCQVVVTDSCPALTLPRCLADAEVQLGDTFHDVLGCSPDARTLTVDLEGT